MWLRCRGCVSGLGCSNSDVHKVEQELDGFLEDSGVEVLMGNEVENPGWCCWVSLHHTAKGCCVDNQLDFPEKSLLLLGHNIVEPCLSLGLLLLEVSTEMVLDNTGEVAVLELGKEP